MNAGISDGDILVVDRSLNPTDKKIVIADVNGELTVKRIRKVSGSIFLVPENDQYSPIKITEGMEFKVWGVVTAVVLLAGLILAPLGVQSLLLAGRLHSLSQQHKLHHEVLEQRMMTLNRLGA